MGKILGIDELAAAVKVTGDDPEEVDEVVRTRIARFRGDDNSSMMGGWT